MTRTPCSLATEHPEQLAVGQNQIVMGHEHLERAP
jgi:hypothetical protein